MNVYTFMGEHPILTFILAYLATSPVRYGYKAYNRYLRSQNIQKKGWPPAHLDADGDFKPK